MAERAAGPSRPGAGDGQRAKVFGERHCGTHWLEAMLVANGFDIYSGTAPSPVQRLAGRLPGGLPEALLNRWFWLVGRRNLGWKHARLTEPLVERLAGGIAGVAIVKHPLSWAVSMHRQPYHARLAVAADLGTFLQSPWRPVARDHASVDEYPNLLALWDDKVSSYLAARRAGLTILRYEDLLADPGTVMSGLLSSWGVDISADEVVVPVGRVKPLGAGVDSYRRHYLEEMWRADFDEGVLERAASIFPASASQLGYAA